MSLCYRRRGEWRMDSKKILGNLFFYGHLNFLDITVKFAMQSYILLKFKHMILITQFYNTYIQ